MEEEIRIMRQVVKTLSKLESADARRRILQYLLDHNAEDLMMGYSTGTKPQE